MLFCSVALLDKPLDALTYRCIDGVGLGSIVQVPIRHQSLTGVVVGLSNEAPKIRGRIRAVLEVVESEPIISPPMLEMLKFMALYYGAFLGDCLRLAMPGGMMRAGRCFFRPTEAFLELTPEMVSDLGVEASTLAALKLALSEQSEGLTAKQLRQLGTFNQAALDGFLDRHLLEAHWELDRARRQESTHTHYVSLDVETPRKLGSKQAQILEHIRGAGPAGVVHESLVATFGSCTPVLKRLEELGLLRSSTSMSEKSSFDDIVPLAKEVVLSDEQELAIASICAQRGYGGFLLHGVTGSGKTEVYIGAMRAARERGLGCLLILPEIALTPQFCAIFQGHFGKDVAVLHSGLSEIERYDTWMRLRTGRLKIAIGARSALFAPIQKLGLIVVDEEHDTSFKQDSQPRYNARDMALVLGMKADCPVVLGSATPSLESYYRVKEGKLKRLMLTRRPLERPMPDLEIVDMRQRDELELPQDCSESEAQLLKLRAQLVSPELEGALREVLERGEQAIIFLNRRGHATFVQCQYCGHVLYCPNCDVSLTYHRFAKTMRCHYCDFSQSASSLCPKCQRPDLAFLGYGTERLVELFQKLLGPNARIDRLDRDRASSKGIRDILDAFKAGDIDVLIGTQMLAKGHDIHNVTLVGIISADMSLNMPDFRASERSFQLLTQVSGRAGRGTRPGRVIIQAMRPEHPVLDCVRERDYERFAIEDLKLRQVLNYPPFVSLAMIRVEAEDPIEAENAAIYIAKIAHKSMLQGGEILGPAPAPIPILCGKMRIQLFLKHPKRAAIHYCCHKILQASQALRKQHPKIKIILDVDPFNMM